MVGETTSLMTNWGTAGIGFINADLTLALSRLPEGPEIGIEADNHLSVDGISVGSTTMSTGADRSARASSAHCRTPSGSWGSAADPRRSRTRQEEALGDQVGDRVVRAERARDPVRPGLTQPRVEQAGRQQVRRDEHAPFPSARSRATASATVGVPEAM